MALSTQDVLNHESGLRADLNHWTIRLDPKLNSVRLELICKPDWVSISSADVGCSLRYSGDALMVMRFEYCKERNLDSEYISAAQPENMKTLMC